MATWLAKRPGSPRGFQCVFLPARPKPARTLKDTHMTDSSAYLPLEDTGSSNEDELRECRDWLNSLGDSVMLFVDSFKKRFRATVLGTDKKTSAEVELRSTAKELSDVIAEGMEILSVLPKQLARRLQTEMHALQSLLICIYAKGATGFTSWEEIRNKQYGPVVAALEGLNDELGYAVRSVEAALLMHGYDRVKLVGANLAHAATGSDAAEPSPPLEANAAHSTDFRSVRWFGERFTFTTTQAACIRILWQNWEQGTPVISELTVLDSAGATCDRLRDVFNKGKHPAWGTLVRPAVKGAFCLAEPDES